MEQQDVRRLGDRRGRVLIVRSDLEHHTNFARYAGFLLQRSEDGIPPVAPKVEAVLIAGQSQRPSSSLMQDGVHAPEPFIDTFENVRIADPDKRESLISSELASLQFHR